MKSIVVGLGIQGRKRQRIAGDDAVATVDPVNSAADYQSVEQVPLDRYDAALVCTPDGAKLALLEYLLSRGKHVLVEKPLFAGSSEKLKRLRELAESSGAVCYTAYNHRFEPNLAHLKRVLDEGRLGRPYLVRMFYGNGTAADVRRSPWRDQGLGVTADLGSHLLDLVDFLFGRPDRPFEVWTSNCLENNAYDHAVIGSAGSGTSPVFELEMTLLSWRNSFYCEVFAEGGSAHVDCLCKWGPSTLTIRQRILPSGKPTEERFTVERPDPTWAVEYEHFKGLCQTGGTNIGTDIWIDSVLSGFHQQLDLGGTRKWAA
jgi:scyllo-inositol 2-dehydrogenase (NADP+)